LEKHLQYGITIVTITIVILRILTMTTQTEPPLRAAALIVGAGGGDATGGAIAKRFAREGLVACVTRRSAEKLAPLVDEITRLGGQARGFASDARKEDEVVALVDTIEREVGPIEVMVFNIGANVPCSILDETARKYFKIWEMACFGGFLAGREVARRMVTRVGARQTILFTGATASVCAARPTSLPLPAPSMRCARWRKAWRASWGRRTSMWRTWWSMARSTPTSSATELPRALCAEGPGRHPEPRPHCRQLLACCTQQPRDAWTHELDLRPWMERW
jgi:NAD(P)-dependent dehydrogenase (short-subunit alcohol dehydrogenase family)